MHPVRASCLRLLFAVCLLVLLNGCAMGVPRSGMGALFTTPEAAFADALGPEGWLDEGLDQLVLHQYVETREGAIVLYSGYSGDSGDAGPRTPAWCSRSTGVIALTLFPACPEQLRHRGL